MPNIQVIGVPEEEDTKKRHEKIREEIIVESFPKMGNTPRHILNTPRHMLIKLTKIKHKKQILKAAREKP